ncbi:hypothetical protein LZP69_10680 [Shewanella sp. AS1]|uniref:hypothetical protein n=1 Tax=Shewanella sp. AS1 TaxID=2907626 RepID=UPI001F282CD1|nr:hypothetical protein [Shewanella sp. AS1]MCE9679625.1 hypothetical protein [Shewanella sp. AS1]
MTLNDLATAQDAMNAAINQAVSDFLTACPDATFQHGHINLQYPAEGGSVTPVASTTVECTVDGARITRRLPENS